MTEPEGREGSRVMAGILTINILVMVGGVHKRPPSPVSHGGVIYEQCTNGMYEGCTNLKAGDYVRTMELLYENIGSQSIFVIHDQ